MAVAIACPNAQEFEKLASGIAATEEMEQFASHLEQCNDCTKRMDAVGDQSLLMKALRAHVSQQPDDAHLQPLMAKLEKLGDPYATAADATPNPAAAEISTDPGLKAALQDTEIEFSRMLAPAQESGELGRLGTYRVLKILGAGGMGVVFQAEDTVLKRRVALKAMRPEFASSASLRQRFLREAQAAAAVHHDHVVVIHYAGEESGVAFLTMELLEGESLEARLRRQLPSPPGRGAGGEGAPLPIAETLRIGREIAEGLAAAHEHGLIHRDIKPNNIWLQNGRARVKILDFGLARATDGDGQLTAAGAIVGTPAYMSPEQANAEPVDFRTDLFSLGCVLYRLCTGVVPFPGSGALQILRAVAEHQPKSPRELNPALPAELSALVMRLLEKDRGKRPESARQIAADIAAIAYAPAVVPAPPQTPPHRPNRLPWAIAAALLLSIPGAYWLSQIVIQFTDENGKKQQIVLPKGANGVKIVTAPQTVVPTGEPLSPLALVASPAKLAEVESWTLETVGHRGHINALALSLDGKYLASGGEDGCIRIWNVSEDYALARVLVDNGPLGDMAWSPNGKNLAARTLNPGRTSIWDVSQGRKISVDLGTGDLSWSPDGKTLLVNGWLVNPITGERIEEVSAGSRSTYLGDGETIAGLIKGKIELYRSSDHKRIGGFDLPKNSTYLSDPTIPTSETANIAWSLDRTRFAVTGDKRVWIIDGRSGKVIAANDKTEMGRGSLVAWSPDGSRCAVVRNDWSVAVLKARTGEIEFVTGSIMVIGAGQIRNLAWTSHEEIAVATQTQPDYGPAAIKVFHIGKDRAPRMAFGSSGPPSRVYRGWISWSKKGDLFFMYSGGYDGHEVWDVTSGARLANKQTFGSLSPDENLAFRDDTVFDAISGRKIIDLDERTVPPARVRWSYDSKFLITSGHDGKVRLCDALTGKELKQFQLGQGSCHRTAKR